MTKKDKVLIDGLKRLSQDIADIAAADCSFDALKTELDALGDRIGVQIRIQRSEIFEAMHQI